MSTNKDTNDSVDNDLLMAYKIMDIRSLTDPSWSDLFITRYEYYPDKRLREPLSMSNHKKFLDWASKMGPIKSTYRLHETHEDVFVLENGSSYKTNAQGSQEDVIRELDEYKHNRWLDSTIL